MSNYIIIHSSTNFLFLISRQNLEANISYDEKLRMEIKELMYSDQCLSFKGIPIDIPRHYTLGDVENNITSLASNSDTYSDKEDLAIPLISR